MLPKQLCLTLAKRLTAVRLQKAWTRNVLAEVAHVNVHTLKRFECSGQISLERLISICVALDNQYEIERLFKPRHRVDADDWQARVLPTRKRGRRQESPVNKK